jgi:cytochrome c peroxidase
MKPTIENSTTPLINKEDYQRELREVFGEELAAICNLPYEQRVKAIADQQNNFDTPHDKIWPAEGYTGPDLP